MRGIMVVKKGDIRERIICLVSYLLTAYVFHVIIVGIRPASGIESIWFSSIVGYLAFHYLSAYFFSKPGESLAISLSSLILLWSLNLTGPLLLLKQIGLIINILVITSAIIGYFFLKSQNSCHLKINEFCYSLCNQFGRAEVIFSFPFLISTLYLSLDHYGIATYLLFLWIFYILIKPVEAIMHFVKLTFLDYQQEVPIGQLLRIDSPNLIRVTIFNGEAWNEETGVVSVCVANNRQLLAIPLFHQIQDDCLIGTGLCVNLPLEHPIQRPMPGYVYSISTENREQIISKITADSGTIAGFVVENSSISNLRFEVTNSTSIKQGRLVFCLISDKKIYYQITEAITFEETFTNNPRGTHIITATQIGEIVEGYFVKYEWLPQMNSPVFSIVGEVTVESPDESDLFTIGTFPETRMPIRLNYRDLVTYHTAILGVTGTGKTELVFDIIRQGLERDTKIICIDVTGDYKDRLSDLSPIALGLNQKNIETLGDLLFQIEVGEFSASGEKRALKQFVDQITPTLQQNIRDFLSSSDASLGLFELPDIANTRATLRATELFLSQIFNWAKLNRTGKSVQIVLEEAHTIVPEANFYYRDRADTQAAIGRVTQIALQGRKYGVGLLIVSQRTALVSKTILSQCNTCITFNLVDKTSLDYLDSVYSSQHVKVIPNLKFLQALVFGKAVKSERPVIVEIPYEQGKKDASAHLQIQDTISGREVAST